MTIWIDTSQGAIAADYVSGGDIEKPAIFWLGGFRSDMRGSKVAALREFAAATGRGFCAFDYYAHGASEGAIHDFTLSRAIENAQAVLSAWQPRRAVFVGSSMGAWIALRLAQIFEEQNRSKLIAGMVLIAPAPDFTEKLIWQNASDIIKNDIMENGVYYAPSQYSDQPYAITRKLIEDGRQHLVMDAPFHCAFPVHILQGLEDPDVPWTHAQHLGEVLQGQVTLSLIRNGDHRLSRPENIAQMISAVEAMD